ncbi:MAG: NUDIX hydrolase, partial [Lentisphaeria bacterium]|nr:NUDIX hydrolase [Lentisphaeria bacterium]
MKKVTLGSGKWIKLEEIEYQDKDQNSRKWERASRLNDLGAVGILATLQPTNRLILIKQFRPPVNNT